MSAAATVFARSYFHGTRADLAIGDMIAVGYASNFTATNALSWVYFTGTLDAAIWGAELSKGESRQRIYVVEPTGEVVDDPNLTDKKFPGNPSHSYRSRAPLRIIAEVTGWQGHPREQLDKMRAAVAKADPDGADIID